MTTMAFLQHVFIISHILPFMSAINVAFLPCDTNGNATIVDCSNRQLSCVPPFKSTTVTSLDLSKTKIKEVGVHAFLGVPNLSTLKIAMNCLPGRLRALDDRSCKMDINLYAFKSLTKLLHLNLSGNSLTSIPWLPETLEALDLQYNSIFNIASPLNTPNLKHLFLSKNCFYANPCYQSFYISEGVFSELPKLQNLTLGYNNLTSVPKGLPHSLVHLDLRENTITEISENAFANLTALKNLNLEWNCQRCDHAFMPCYPCPGNASLKLHSDSFYAENSSIEELLLRGNSLYTFPEHLFKPMRNLKVLDISDNYLMDYAISNGSFFTDLKGLKFISLIYNYKPLKTFEELNLSPHLGDISGLEYLLLSGNFFRTLSLNSLQVLSKLHNLKKIELRMNFINASNFSALTTLPSLSYIDLSQNMLSFLSCCSSLRLGSVYQQSSQNQNFHEYNILDPPFMQRDREVTRNDVWEPDETKVLDVLQTNMSKIPQFWEFKHHYCLSNLTIDLSQNDILVLTPHVFSGMENAVCLDLSFNYMNQRIQPGLFDKMTNLVFLNLSYNRLDLYDKKAFSELNANLKVLDLSNNEFNFQMRGMGHCFQFLHNLTKLEVLSLANNDIGMRLDHRLFSSSLKYLDFHGNHLDIMWESTNNKYTYFFQNLTSLIYLDISNNKLKSISPDILVNFPKSTEILIIKHNSLTYFPWEKITELSNLWYLDLSHNYLTDLPYKAIEFGARFSHLDLSNNHIAVIPTNFLMNLQSLYINDNHIKELNQSFFCGLTLNSSSLRKLKLHYNPFKCDCSTSWFADFLRTTHIEIPNLSTLIRCEYPESQQGQTVLSMDKRSCQDIYGSVAFLISCFLVVIFVVFPLLKHLYGWDLWYCIQVLWAGYKGYTQLAGSDYPFDYDAFVVFDTSNQAVRDWVYNELTVHLENSGHRRFCLCLEERDWIPGLSCIENLHSAVYRSMKTVFVLSSGGETVSGVIRQAFFMVQQRLLDEKVDVTVLVLLDEMFPKLKYLQLRRRLCGKSVLSWPRNPRAHPIFWNHMRRALSSDNLKFYDHNMSESFT